jgi:signal transduction histidine kinase
VKQRTAARLGWSLWVLIVGFELAAVALSILNRDVERGPSDTWVVGLAFGLVSVAFGTVGALVASRHPRNPIGWLFLAMGLTSVGGLADGYATYALSRPGSLPGGQWAAWTADFFISSPGLLFGVFALLFLVFPDGHLPSPRWRPVAWAAVVVIVLLQTLVILAPGPLPGFPSVRNPAAVPSVVPLQAGEPILFFALLVLIGLSVVSLVLRYRRSRGEERQQMKWFATAAGFLGLVIASGPAWWFSGTILAEAVWPLVFAAGLITVPVACGIAISRHRLYDIDLVINRTVVYGALAAFITAAYVGIVVGLGNLLGAGDEPNLALSIAATAVVAVLFQPVRSRVQQLANRLVYGKRASPYELLSQFSDRVAGSYAAEDVLERLARVVAEGTGARLGGVWLRVGEELHPAASWPAEQTLGDPVPATDPPAIEGADRTFPVREGHQLIGALTVTKAAGDPLRPAEEKLTEDIASQAGLVLRNVRLTAELQRRLDEISRQAEELRASRRRIVATQDRERRRLERDIHDGAQQHLVALAVNVNLARTMVRKDPQRARPAVEALERAAADALATLRNLAGGIYPPVLESEGLAGALRAQTAGGPIPVEIRAEGLGRMPEEVEAAAYFSVLEALQNSAKYAGASRTVVELENLDGHLAFEVTDDGRGFDPGTTPRGSGLQNIADRLAVLGGSVEVRSTPGRGTTVTGRIPVPEREGAA